MSGLVSNRWVIVDDASPDIKYIGDSWFPIDGSLDVGDFGPPFLSTLHGTNRSASFTFNFTGPAVRVIGAKHTSVTDPQWACSVDGNGIDSSNPPFGNAENNLLFCHSDSLMNGSHTLTVDATLVENQTFWFDHLEYIPSSTVSLENKMILLPREDPALQFGSAWNNYATKVMGARFALNFYGTSVLWYGEIPPGHLGNSSCTWSIDDNPTQTFVLHGTESNYTYYNQKFFETTQYPMGPHKLTVVYNGNGSTTPLTVDRLIIQNGTLTSSSSAADPRPMTRTGIIVGGVVGASAACLLIVLLLIFLVRRRRDSARARRVTIDPPSDYVQPFPQNFVSISTEPHLSLVHSEQEVQLANTSHSVTIPPAPPRQEGHPPVRVKRKARHTTGNVAAQGFEASEGDRQHSRITLDPVGGLQVASPPGFIGTVHQDSGVRLTSQVPPMDIPPAYTPG